MRLKTAEIDHFIAKPPDTMWIALLYGPDEGLVRERAVTLARTVLPDLKDPFRLIDLADEDLKNDPARVADEFGSISMLGGRRVIRIRTNSEKTARILTEFIESVDKDNLHGDALVILQAGDLKPSSALRKRAESAKRAVAIPCYVDDQRRLRQIIVGALKHEGLGIAQGTLELLVEQLGGDRAVTRQELEKLVLYKKSDGDASNGDVTEDDLRAVVASANLLGIEDVSFAAVSAEYTRLQESLNRCFLANIPPVTVIRAVSRHLEQLALALAAMASGAPLRRAVEQVRPRIHFLRRAAFESQLKQWNKRRCRAAQSRLFDCEIACKTTGMPAETLCRQAILVIARSAGA